MGLCGYGGVALSVCASLPPRMVPALTTRVLLQMYSVACANAVWLSAWVRFSHGDGPWLLPAHVAIDGERACYVCVCVRNICSYDEDLGENTADRACAVLTTCTDDEFEVTAPVYDNRQEVYKEDRVCARITVCSRTEYQTTAPQQSPAFANGNGNGNGNEVGPRFTGDRECLPLTTCDEVDEFERVAPVSTMIMAQPPALLGSGSGLGPDPGSGVVDAPVFGSGNTSGGSGAGEQRSLVLLYLTDRNCTTISQCSSTEFETAAPTPTSDRTCQACKTECSGSEYTPSRYAACHTRHQCTPPVPAWLHWRTHARTGTPGNPLAHP